MELGQIPELSVTAVETHAPTDNKLDDETRETLKKKGDHIWTMVKSNPELFYDYNASSFSPEKDRNHSDCAAVSGFIRSLAARLVLLHIFQTRNLSIPKLIYRLTDEGQINSQLPLASVGEMEFGLCSLARAGHAIMRYADDPATAYSTLSLAVESWEGIKLIESNNVTMRYRDEIFEVYASLPDSASVIPFQPELETLLNIGTATNVLTHLKNMEDFVYTYCLGNNSGIEESNLVLDQDDNIADDSILLIAMQRYIPILARTSYKVRYMFALICLSSKKISSSSLIS